MIFIEKYVIHTMYAYQRVSWNKVCRTFYLFNVRYLGVLCTLHDPVNEETCYILSLIGIIIYLIAGARFHAF